MTNKKEAKIICSRNCTYNSKDCEKGCETFKDVLQMSKWKDEQFINFLEWIDNVYILRRFSDGESINFKGLVEKFKLMQK